MTRPAEGHPAEKTDHWKPGLFGYRDAETMPRLADEHRGDHRPQDEAVACGRLVMPPRVEISI